MVRRADSILIGDVLVLDQLASRAEAIAIAEGRVLQVGSRDLVMQTAAENSHIFDFTGCTIVPGFNDTHAHIGMPGLTSIRHSLADAKSIKDILKQVRQLAQKTPTGSWIVTMPVGEPPFYFDGPACLAERRMPTRFELDAAAPEHPVYISVANGAWGLPTCYAALNSLGLKLNGIDRNTKPTAAGIEIERDGNGEPTGVFIEHNIASLLELDLLREVPRFTFQDREAALRRAIALYNAKGITSIYEGHGCAPNTVSDFRKLWEDGGLTVRAGLTLGVTWTSLEDAQRTMRNWLSYARGRGLGDSMLRISGVFIPCFGDPAMKDLVRHDSLDLGWGDYVRSANSLEEFERLCMLAGENDLRVHTTLPGRLHEVLPILERVAKIYPIGRRRWVLEHVSTATVADLRRVRELGVAVTLIPSHFLWKTGQQYLNLTDTALDLLSPAKDLIELGVPVSAGTDAVPFDPMFCLWSMVARQERTTRRVMGPNGCLSNEAALRLLTVEGAWLTFDEKVKGPLVPGNYADLAVLSGNPLNATGDDLLDVECRGTMVGGRWVHGPV